jgi:D-tagatose-1,6-bisphosphate aldolase subunit GatZ/KbaZ
LENGCVQSIAVTARRAPRKTPFGVYSVCSAHPWVIEAAIDQALEDGLDLLIAATSNQVNHRGGYTGMQPDNFRQLVYEIAARKRLDKSRLILGGDHWGPNPWQRQPAAEAKEMVGAYMLAGFRKIHLDASMSSADDPHPLPGLHPRRRHLRFAVGAIQTAITMCLGPIAKRPCR